MVVTCSAGARGPTGDGVSLTVPLCLSLAFNLLSHRYVEGDPSNSPWPNHHSLVSTFPRPYQQRIIPVIKEIG